MNLISIAKSRGFKMALACAAVAVIPNVAFATTDLSKQVLDETSASLKRIVTSLATVLQVGLGIAALVTLVFVVINLLKGEREAASKIGWWVVGLAIGFGAITVVANLIK